MDKAALVSVDIERGAEIIGILDHSGLRLKVALWAVLPEYEDWRLVVASPQLDRPDLRNPYAPIIDALVATGFKIENTPPIVILPMTDRTIKHLRKVFGKTKRVEGMRLGGQMLGDRFVDDAYVYRIS